MPAWRWLLARHAINGSYALLLQLSTNLVAVQTVYVVFHTKAALLARAIDFAVMGKETPRPPEEQPWYRAMRDAPGIDEALRHLVTGVGAMMPGVIPLTLAARASDDPELARVMAETDGWRADGYRAMLEILRGKAPLREGLDPERATHLLLLYVGEDVYHVLVDTYRCRTRSGSTGRWARCCIRCSDGRHPRARASAAAWALPAPVHGFASVSSGPPLIVTAVGAVFWVWVASAKFTRATA
jgi:hypothetical protein